MNAVETIKRNGLTMRLFPDETQGDMPRDWDNLGTMACWHHNYRLGDYKKLPYDPSRYSPTEYLRALAASLVRADDADAIPDEHIERILEKHTERLPLYLYEHGGITINTGGFSCPWDSGQVGFIYVTRDRIIAEYGDDSPESRERARKCMTGEVETYDQFLRGDVYGYTIEDAHGECLDICWGFYGYDNALSEATDALDACLAEKQETIEVGLTITD